jgi:hypothetical protein
MRLQKDHHFIAMILVLAIEEIGSPFTYAEARDFILQEIDADSDTLRRTCMETFKFMEQSKLICHSIGARYIRTDKWEGFRQAKSILDAHFG